MDVIPLDTSLIKGSHGRITDDPTKGAILIAPEKTVDNGKEYKQTDIFEYIKTHFSKTTT
jgi:hypothetical protein